MNDARFGFFSFFRHKLALGGIVALISQQLLLIAQPDNDHFGNRTHLVGSDLSAVGTFFHSTRESLDPGQLHEGTVWWSWVAPRAGHLQISRTPVESQSVKALILFRGNSRQTLQTLGSSTYDPAKRLFPPIVFRVNANETYSVLALGAIESTEFFTLRLVLLPVNDLEPTIISGDSFELAGTTVNALPETDYRALEKLPAQSPTVSWEWTAPASGRVCYALQAGSVPELRHAGFRLESGLYDLWDVKKSLNGGNTFFAYEGQQYRFYFYSDPWRVGDFRWQMTLSEMQIGFVSAAVPLRAGDVVEVLATNLPAVTPQSWVLVQNGIPLQTNASAPLFEWRPTSAGLYELGVYAVESTGRLWLSLTNVMVRPSNDDLAHALELPTTAPYTNGLRFLYATTEPEEPIGLPSVWYRWNAPAGVRARIDVIASFEKPYAMCEVYHGETFASFEQMPSFVRTNALGTRTFFFDTGSGGPIAFALRATNAPPFLRFAFTSGPVPENDYYANRLALAGAELEVEGDVTMASPEDGENKIAPSGSGRTIWYSWTSPADGDLMLTVSSTNKQMAPVVGLLTNWNSSAPRVRIDEPDFKLRALVRKGAQYVIGLDCRGPLIGDGTLLLKLLFEAAPENDSQPAILVGSTIDFQGTLAGATGSGYRDVYYEWTAPVSGEASFTLFDTHYHRVKVSVWESQSEYQTVTNFYVFGAFQAQAGRKYLFEISQSAFPMVGLDFSGRLTVDPAVNDMFANRLPIDSNRTNFFCSTLGATSEAGDPPELNNTLWWTWTAPANGWLWLRTKGKAQVAVYTGNSPAELNEVQTRIGHFPENYAQTSPMLGFEALQGGTYNIVVGQTNNFGITYPFFLDFTTLHFTSPTNDAVVPEGLLAVQLAAASEQIDGFLSRPSILVLGWGNVVSRATNLSDGFVITNIPSGKHALIARTTNNLGELRISGPLDFTVRPSNDNFDMATDLSLLKTSRIAFAEATIELGEPPLLPDSQTGSVWWKWTSPVSGEAQFQIGDCGPTNKLKLEVFIGSSLATLQRISVDRRLDRGDMLHRFVVEKNEQYYIRLSNPGECSALERFEITPVSIVGMGPGLTFVNGRGYLEVAVDVPHEEVASVELYSEGILVGTAVASPFLILASPPREYPSSGLWYARALLKNGETLQSFVYPWSIRFKDANDDFSQRVPVSGSNLIFYSSLISNATREPGEPSHGVANMDQTLWWTWTAPANGILNIPPFPSVATAVYTGGEVSALTLVRPLYGSSRILVEGRVSYHIAIASQSRFPAVKATFSPLVSPVVDLLQTRKTNVLVQFGTFEPSGLPQERKFLWTAPSDGLAVSMAELVAQPRLFRGADEVSLEASEGGVYAWRVHKHENYAFVFRAPAGSDDVSRFQWNFALHPLVANEIFANAYPLPAEVSNFPVLDWHYYAPGEPDYEDNLWTTSRSGWFKWTAPRSTTMLLRGVYDKALIYQGDSLTSLRLVARGTAFWVEAGSTYYIIIVQTRPYLRDYFLTLEPMDAPAPENDLFTHAAWVYEYDYTFYANNRGATREFGEPAHGGSYSGRTVWWKWWSPTSGEMEIRITPGPLTGTRQVAVYRGDSVTNLERVQFGEFSTAPGSIVFEAERETMYSIAFAGDYAAEVDAQIRLIRTDRRLEFVNIIPMGDQIMVKLSGPVDAAFDLETCADLKTWRWAFSGVLSGGFAKIYLAAADRQFFRFRLQSKD